MLDTGANDAGLRADGPLTLDLGDPTGPKIVADFAPTGLEPAAELQEKSLAGTHGILYEPMGAVVRSGFEYRFAQGRVVVNGRAVARWRLTKFDPGDKVLGTDPNAQVDPHKVKRIFFDAPADKFEGIGYYNYGGGYMNATYNSAIGKNLLFATLLGSPMGCWVLDMDRLIEFLDNTDQNATTVPDQLLKLGVAPWDSAVVGELTTHPEFWNFPDHRDTGSAGVVDFLTDPNVVEDEYGILQGGVRSLYPEIFLMPGPDGTDRWILAVPCGPVYCDETLAYFQNAPESGWVPNDPFRSTAVAPYTMPGLHHMMIRFFDITDDSKFALNDPLAHGVSGSPDLPAWTIIGPQAVDGNPVLNTTGLGASGVTDGDFRPKGSSANDLEIASVTDAAGAERFFCFVADLAGSVQVFEITDILSTPPDLPAGSPGRVHYGGTLSIPTPFATRLTKDSIADGNPAGAWSLEVDQVSFVDDDGVQRDHTYVYVSVARVGIEVYLFDVNKSNPTDRLRFIDLIQTPGEEGYLHLWEGDPPIVENENYPSIHTPRNGTTGKKLLFLGNSRAGLRIYGYEE